MWFYSEIKRRRRIRARGPTPKRFTDRLLTGKLLFASLGVRVCVCVGGAFNDAMGRLGNMGYLEREKGEKESISELKSLILGHRMGINSPGNLKIPCPIS